MHNDVATVVCLRLDDIRAEMRRVLNDNGADPRERSQALQVCHDVSALAKTLRNQESQ